MLEKPDLSDESIITVLQKEYGLSIAAVSFLPLGADLDTAVYRAITPGGTPAFVKLRRGDFDEASVAVPKFLSDRGLKQVIAPLPTRTGRLWAGLDPYRLILYPFVEGSDAFEVDLSDAQRIEFGAALRALHTAVLLAAITNHVRREAFAPRWRETTRAFLTRIEKESFADPVAAELAAFLQIKRDETLELIRRAGRLALALQVQTPEYVLCHGDIHGWNLLVDAHNALYMVDWDTLVFAPKERDLMFVGSGLGGNGHTLREEEDLFYQGYGWVERSQTALAYYRYERIIEDVAVYCEQILLTDEGGEDRRQALAYLKSNFEAGGTIEIAYQIDKTA